MNPQPTRFFNLSLVFLVALNFIPHFNNHTIPVLAVGGICLGWRLLYEFQYVPLPNIFTKVGLVLSLSYLIYLNFGQILGLESGSALLICAVALKMVDRVGYRDAMVLIFLIFMLLLARFFDSQSLGITIFAAFDLIITTALLVHLHNGSQTKFDPISFLRLGGKIILQISPLMILLFFVFPRFSTNFVASSGQNPRLKGFSDSMEPGAMSRLAQADQVAFRVRFFNGVPSPVERYWPGAVLTLNQGMKWERGRVKKEKIKDSQLGLKTALRQEILMEPSFKDWLLTLDKPLWVEQRRKDLQSKMRRVQDSFFGLSKGTESQFIYDAYSITERQETLSTSQRKVYLQIRPEDDDRLKQLVTEISGDGASAELKAGRLMRFYQNQFRYTLSPGKMSSQNVSEFLFEKKIGFCEHFATSFAAVMRLAGVPSRVVVGFQGGRKNQMSDYYLVTSKDAHAWTEIWSDQKRQWLRFDPTTMVSPLRFEVGGEVYHSLSEDQLLGESGDILASFQGGWFGQTQLFWDALATNWNLFLLNYDRGGQSRFFARLGIDKINQTLLLSLSLIVLLIFYLVIRRMNRIKTKKMDPAQVIYLDLRKHLAQRGIEKKPQEGPSDFLKRCQEEIPEKKQSMEEFRLLYLQSYYGEEPELEGLRQLKKSLVSR